VPVYPGVSAQDTYHGLNRSAAEAREGNARQVQSPHPPSLILLGILAVIVGIFAIAWPGVTILALVIVVAAWALAGGVAEFFAGFQAGEGAGTRALFITSGLVSVAFGVLLFARPGVGAVTLALLFGLYALIYGFWPPDAIDLPCPQCKYQTFAPNPAGPADRFGSRQLLPGRPRIRDRKEQIRSADRQAAACRHCPRVMSRAVTGSSARWRRSWTPLTTPASSTSAVAGHCG
jgi:hypothetical protein